MRIYLEHEGEELGPYGRERVLHGVRSGKWPPSTRARAEESRKWTTLGELLADELAAPRPEPPAPPAAVRPVEKKKPQESLPARPPFKAFLFLFLAAVLVYLYTMKRAEPKEPVRSFETDPPAWMASPQLPVPEVLPPVSPTPSPSPTAEPPE
ncbi:MAG TPA: hypothetical protein VNQ90_21010 [Chthoniobacteraceae bacterium]|nr:hypothetical protein [Chthoniobacteraceae bacterium]